MMSRKQLGHVGSNWNVFHDKQGIYSTDTGDSLFDYSFGELTDKKTGKKLKDMV